MNNILNIKKSDVRGDLDGLRFSDSLLNEFQKEHGELDVANSFLYFVRRFGFSEPNDTYKQLASYLLECEEYPDIYPYINLTTGVYITFFIKEQKMKYFEKKYFGDATNEYYKQFYLYLMETNQMMNKFEEEILVFIKNSVESLRKEIPVYECEVDINSRDFLFESFSRINNWEDFINEIPNFMQGFHGLAHRHNEAYILFNNWIEPREIEFQNAKNIKKPSFEDITENDEMSELKQQCLKILENFLIPTYIRDVNYNIYGQFTDDTEEIGLIEYFEEEVN